MENSLRKPGRNALKKFLRVALALALIASVGHVLRVNLSKVDFDTLHVRPGWLALSGLCYFVHVASQGLIWHWLSHLCEALLPLRASFSHWAYSQLGKYVPGKVARVGYLALVYKDAGHDFHKVTTLLGLEFVGNLAGVMLVISTCTVLAGASAGSALPQGVETVGAVLLALSIACLHPAIVNFGLKILARVLRRPLAAMRFSFREILRAVPAYALSYLFLAASNWFLFVSLLGTETTPAFPLATAVFGAAGLAGSFAFFAPGGLGAREALLQLGLQSVLGGPLASVLTVASRAWFTVCEMAFIAIVWLFARARRAPKL